MRKSVKRYIIRHFAINCEDIGTSTFEFRVSTWKGQRRLSFHVKKHSIDANCHQLKEEDSHHERSSVHFHCQVWSQVIAIKTIKTKRFDLVKKQQDIFHLITRI